MGTGFIVPGFTYINGSISGWTTGTTARMSIAGGAGGSGQSQEKQLTKDSSQSQNMSSIISRFKSIFASEPEKSLRKANLLDEAGDLRSESLYVCVRWLIEKNFDAFKAEVLDPMIADIEKEKKA